MPASARTRKTPVAPLDLRPIKRALTALATLDDPDAVMPFVDYCEDLIAEVERLRAQIREFSVELRIKTAHILDGAKGTKTRKRTP